MNLVKKCSIFGSMVIASLAIAQSASASFVIFVPGNDRATLQRVRAISPAAFVTQVNNQPVVQAGVFNSETSADSLAIALQQSGLSAQKYIRNSSGNLSAATVSPTATPQQVIIQPTQSAFIQPSTAIVPNYDSSVVANNSFVSQPISTVTSTEPLLPQATQNPNFRYITAVPANPNNQLLLSRIRQYVPNAFFSNSGRGTYIHAGAYQNRDAAESVSRYLRSQGVDSRVLYF